MNVTISFDEHKVRNTEKIEDIKVLMLKGEKGDAGMTPEDVMDVVEPYLATYAPLNSPALTGTPTAPTATAGSDTTQIATTAYVKNEVDSKLSSTYKAKGSVAFASLPALIAANEGNVYNVTDAFTTTSDFVEGSGKSYPAGTNVVIVNTTGTTYKYDVLSGFVDLSGYLTSSDAANTYLSQSDASSTYLTQSDASSTYLTQSDASSTYLSQSDASSTYATQTALGNTDAKVGSGTLDIGSDLTDGVNQLNSNIGVKTLAELGLTTPCTIRQIVEALPYGASVVISVSTGNISDLNTTGELYIRTAASSSVLHKTDLVFRSNTASATSLDGRYLIGMLPGTGNAKWYKPTITEVSIT